MSQLFVDNIKNRTGGAVGFPTGVVVTGVATFNNQVSIAGTLTYEDVTNVDSTGIITAKSGVKVTGGEILVKRIWVLCWSSRCCYCIWNKSWIWYYD